MDILLEKEGVAYKYSCLMWFVPEFYSDLINSWGKLNIPDDKLYIDPLDPALGREDEIHLTIKYGLHTKNPEDVKKIVSNFPSFPVSFGKISKFNSEAYDVIKMEIISEKLMELNAIITSSLKCTDKYPIYKPHVTIAYVKKNSCDGLLDKKIFNELTITAKDTILSIAGDDGTDGKCSIPLKV